MTQQFSEAVLPLSFYFFFFFYSLFIFIVNDQSAVTTCRRHYYSPLVFISASNNRTDGRPTMSRWATTLRSHAVIFKKKKNKFFFCFLNKMWPPPPPQQFQMHRCLLGHRESVRAQSSLKDGRSLNHTKTKLYMRTGGEIKSSQQVDTTQLVQMEHNPWTAMKTKLVCVCVSPPHWLSSPPIEWRHSAV